MKRKTTNSLVIASVVTALIVGIMLFGGVNFATLGGFTTLSLAKADFFMSSTSPYFNQPLWILNVQQGGLGQYAEGIIDTADIAKSGTTPEKDLKLSIGYSKQTCEYPITSSYDTAVYKMSQPIEWTCAFVPSQTDANSHCPNGAMMWGKYPNSITCYCVQSILEAQVGEIGNPYVHTVSDITATAGSASETKRFDTKATISGFLGNNVYVQWAGYSSSGTPCDYQGYNYGVYKNGVWTVSKYTDYTAYKTQLALFENVDQTSPDHNKVVSVVNNLNSAADVAMYPSGFGSVLNPTSSTGALVTKDVSGSFVNFPNWVFYVKADWLGIHQPVAKPSITSASSPCFKSDASGIIYANVKNVGDEDGNVNVWVTCTSPFSQKGGTITNSIAAGDSFTYQIPVQTSVASKTTGTCTIYAQALDIKTSKTVSVCSDPIIVCDANGQAQCQTDFKTIIKCNSGGSGWNIISDCASANKTCKYNSNNLPECVGGGGSNETCTKVDKACGGVLDKECCSQLTCTGAIPLIGGGVCKAGNQPQDNTFYYIIAALVALIAILAVIYWRS